MISQFKRIGIVNYLSDDSTLMTIQSLLDLLQRLNVEIVMETEALSHLGGLNNNELLQTNSMPRAELSSQCDLLIVIGGDGSMLHTARDTINAQVPILGINRGRLGFLTDILPEELEEQVEEVLKGGYTNNERFLIEAEILRDYQVIGRQLALNDVVIQSTHSRMIDLTLFIDGVFAYDVRADGLIIATPTGSTAYALSGGGSIIHPKLNAIEVVPINSNNLSNRPMVIDGDLSMCINVPHINRVHIQLVADGQIQIPLEYGDSILIKKYAKSVNFLQLKDHNFFQACRTKLNWNNNS